MILIVDDKSENIFALKQLLEVNKFAVDTALSGEEALRKVLKNTYSLIILDVQMPGMDGFEVAEALSGFSKAKDIPIIFLSAVSTDKKFITKGYSSGGIDYIAKPIDPEILMLKVKTFNRLYEQARELNNIHLALREEIEVGKSEQYEQFRKTQELISILESIPQIAFTANAAGVIEFVNEQWYIYSEDKNKFPVVYDKNIPVPGFWQNAVAARQQLPVEICLRKLNTDEFRYHLLSLIPVSEGRAIVKWVGSLTDIHEQKLISDLLEKRVVKRTTELVVANKELTFLNEDKEKREAELVIANKELVFQNQEKEKRASELAVANDELVFQNAEKEKRASELIVANRLYSFLSEINKTILHAQNDHALLKEACRIAVEIGKFKVAYVCLTSNETDKRYLVIECGMPPGDILMIAESHQNINNPQSKVLKTGDCFVSNDILNESVLANWSLLALEREWRSCMVLPIVKSGRIFATFHIIASRINAFTAEKIRLLKEATNNISFALDGIEKGRLRKISEDKVLYSELRLKQAQAIAHIGNWEEDISTHIETWSEEACRIYDIPVKENIQTFESWTSFIHPADLDDVMAMINHANANQSDTAFYHRIIRKDGTIRYIYSQSHFELDDNGKPIGKYGVVHDVTETRKAEVALAQSEANLRLIMDSIPQLISTRDVDGKYLFVNKSFAKLMGLSPGELLKKNLADTIGIKSEADYYLKQDREVILSGKPKINPEHSFTDHNGNIRIFHTLKIPFTAAGTANKAVLSITSEITEQKLAETERTKMMADIVQRNKDLEQFSYIISHNLRAPVANILGLADVIELPGLNRADKKQCFGFLSESVKKLDAVIIDLNEILKLKHGEYIHKESVSFPELLSDIKLSINTDIDNVNLKLYSNFSEIDGMFTVKSYIHSIFFNLISNSIKYRQPGVEPLIEISSHKYNNKIELVFKDNGLGIDMKKRGEQVFGLYKRFHTHVEGKGIGLYMVKTQVESMNGNISISSEVNKGTEFRIEFNTA